MSYTRKIKLNLTQIQADSLKNIGFAMSVDDVNSLIEKGLTSDKMPDEGKMYIYPNVDELARILPFWEIVHTLKKVSALK